MTSPYVQDEVYRVIGEEVARKEFYPGPMAHAVAEAQGNSDLIQALYIRFRYEQLVREIQNGTAPDELLSVAEAENIRLAEIRGDVVECPNCGHRGIPLQTARGNFAVFLLLLCVYIVPGLIYALAYHGYRGVCAKCGCTLMERI